MGQRIIQRIYECTYCGLIPEDGESIWEMGSSTMMCEKCCDKPEEDSE